jgi:hypothetical protein
MQGNIANELLRCTVKEILEVAFHDSMISVARMRPVTSNSRMNLSDGVLICFTAV